MLFNHQTKYNFGDTIYFMDNNKVQKDVIDLVSVSKFKSDIIKVRYTTSNYKVVNEDEAFSSQEELFKAIQLEEE